MRRRRHVILAGLAMLLAATGMSAVYLLYAVNEVEAFYADAVKAKPEDLESAGKRMEERVEDLYDDEPTAGDWNTVFTDDEVNGWLARFLEQTQPTLLPPEVKDPRVGFVDGGCKLGFSYSSGALDAVVTIEAEAFMVEPDLAAVRLRQARLGALPISMKTVTGHITSGAMKLKIPIRWTEADGDPVLLTQVTDALSTADEARSLQQLEFSEGKVRLVGTKQPRPSEPVSQSLRERWLRQVRQLGDAAHVPSEELDQQQPGRL